MERTSKEKNLKKLLNRTLSYLLLVISIFALCYSTKKIADYVTIKKENQTLEKHLENLKEENDNLEILNDKLKDKEYFSVYVKGKYQYSSSSNSITPIN